MNPMSARQRLERAQDQHISQRLSYRTAINEGDQAFFNPPSSYAFEVLFRSLKLFLLSFVVTFILILIGVTLARSLGNSSATDLSSQSLDGSSSDGISQWLFSVGMLGLLSLLVALVVFIVTLFLTDHQWASQWELMIDGQGDRAGAVANTIAREIQRRDTPIYNESVERKQLKLQGSVMWMELDLKLGPYDGKYGAYVGSYAFGDDLFVSWSMWRSMPAWKVVRTIFDWSDPFEQVLRTDPARAMRDSVHNSVRRAIDEAILLNLPAASSGGSTGSNAPDPQGYDGTEEG